MYHTDSGGGKVLFEEPYKEVFILKVFPELSYKDIACVLNKSYHLPITEYRKFLYL